MKLKMIIFGILVCHCVVIGRKLSTSNESSHRKDNFTNQTSRPANFFNAPQYSGQTHYMPTNNPIQVQYSQPSGHKYPEEIKQPQYYVNSQNSRPPNFIKSYNPTYPNSKNFGPTQYVHSQLNHAQIQGDVCLPETKEIKNFMIEGKAKFIAGDIYISDEELKKQAEEAIKNGYFDKTCTTDQVVNEAKIFANAANEMSKPISNSIIKSIPEYLIKYLECIVDDVPKLFQKLEEKSQAPHTQDIEKDDTKELSALVSNFKCLGKEPKSKDKKRKLRNHNKTLFLETVWWAITKFFEFIVRALFVVINVASVIMFVFAAFALSPFFLIGAGVCALLTWAFIKIR